MSETITMYDCELCQDTGMIEIFDLEGEISGYRTCNQHIDYDYPRE